jgi:HlyD family secretion protein
VPQEQITHLRVGQAGTITVGDNATVLQGKVTVVSPAVDPNSTTIQVWVEAPNPGERLKPGMTVRVSIVAETLRNVVVAPPEAILPGTEGGSSVMVVTADSVAHEHKVQIGLREEDKVQILSGANAGDSVVVVGGVGLSDGAKVKVVKPGEKPDEDEKGEKSEKGDKKDNKAEKE